MLAVPFPLDVPCPRCTARPVIGAWCAPGTSAVTARLPAHGTVNESPNPSYLCRGQGMMMPRRILVLLWAAQRPRDERRPSGLKIALRLICPPLFVSTSGCSPWISHWARLFRLPGGPPGWFTDLVFRTSTAAPLPLTKGEWVYFC